MALGVSTGMRPMRPRGWMAACAAVWLCAACGTTDDGDGSDAGPDGGGQASTMQPDWGALSLQHSFDTFAIAAGEELELCQSWTLENDEALWVTRIDQRNGGSFHHSNWFFVPEDVYAGPDGTWDCGERGFNNIAAGAAGGVFFAQSTQADSESQAFGQGQAVRVPPGSRIVGQVHLLNPTDTDVADTGLSFDVYTADEADVTTPLTPASFSNQALSIPPGAQSRFHMDCALNAQKDGFGLYYLLPHYHALGDYFALSIEGGARDGEVLFETTTAIGEPLGAAFDPPLRVDGADALRMTCGYTSDRDEVVGYGIGDQEMCVVLLYHDADAKFGGAGLGASTEVEPDGDTAQYVAGCTGIGL